jgi:hypothetical protein
MQNWSDRLIECMGEETDDKARDTMVMLKKMRKGEPLPEDFKKEVFVEEHDDVLLNEIEKNLRRMLNTDEFWALKNKSSGTASGTG